MVSMSSDPAANRPGRPVRARRGRALAALALAALLAACATSGALRSGQRAERLEDYDLAVVEYTKALRADPSRVEARQALERAKLRAADAHFFRARRLAASQKFDEALLEYQVAAELNPASGDIDRELKARATACGRSWRARTRARRGSRRSSSARATCRRRASSSRRP